MSKKLENERTSSPFFESQTSTFYQNNVPFNTSTERLYEYQKINNTDLFPGPGSYFENNSFNSFQRMDTPKNSLDNILNDLPMYNLMITMKYNKLKNLQGLKIDKINKNQIKNHIQNLKNNSQKIKNIKLLTFQKNIKECSIPILSQKPKNGIKNAINVLNMRSCFYNKIKKIKEKRNIHIRTKENAHKEIINNSKNFLLSNISTNTSTNNYSNKELSWINGKSERDTGKNNDTSLLRWNKCHEKNKKFFNIIHRKEIWNSYYKNNEKDIIYLKLNTNECKQPKIENISFTGSPGPGYYNTFSPFDKYKKFYNEYKNHNFGSNQNRNMKLIKEKIKSNKNLLYQYYLKIENRSNKNKTSFPKLSDSKISLRDSINAQNIIKQFLELTNPYLTPNNTNNNFNSKKDITLGPGQYNIISQFDKIETKQNSFSSEKRFFELNKKIKPGPGEYLPLENWEKIPKKLNTNINTINENNIKLLKMNLLTKKEPDMWSYNSHILNSIEYDNFNNTCDKIINSRAPFCSSEERFIKKINSTPDIIGPGRYDITNINFKKNKKDIKNMDSKQIEKKEKRERIKIMYKNDLQRIKDNVGPGSYHKFKFYDWKKKSFNIMYI